MSGKRTTKYHGRRKSRTRNKQTKKIIATAGNNVKKSLEALNKLGINVPERHNVLVPGTPTSPENSKLLLRKAIQKDGEIGVYLGITVCPYICKFCRYYNRTGPLKDLDKMAASDVDDVIKEMEIVDKELELPKKPKTSSVYIGGGTPTLMSKESMQKVFENLKRFYDISEDTEITMECTPDSIDEEKIKTMKNLGVNRVSMGVQRLDDGWLKSMNRRHTVSDVFSTLELFNKNEVDYNIDLIYGFEGQSVESFCDDLNKILKYNPAEITLYRFENQKRTDDKSIRVGRSDREPIYIMQEAGRIILLSHGYTEGPDGWFTKKGMKKAKVYEDRWNKQIPLLGLGPEAYSYSKHQQHTNKPFRQYQEAIQKNTEALDAKLTYEYTNKQVDIRRMVFDLKSKFEASFKTDQEQFFISLSEAGLGEIIEASNKKTFKLNRQGIIVVEEIMRVLVEESQKLGEN